MSLTHFDEKEHAAALTAYSAAVWAMRLCELRKQPNMKLRLVARICEVELEKLSCPTAVLCRRHVDACDDAAKEHLHPS